MINLLTSFMRRNKQVATLVIIGIFIIVLISVNYILMKKREAVVIPEETTFKEDVVEVSDIISDFEKSQAPDVVAEPAAKEAPAPGAPTNGAYVIQVASFKTKERAEPIVSKLQSKGFDASIIVKDLGAKGVWYRVLVGRFPTKSAANELLKAVQKEYKESFISLQ